MVCRWDGGSREMGKWVFSKWGRWGKASVQTFSNLFLKAFLKAVTTAAGSLFHYFTNLTESADPFVWRWLVPWSTL